MNLPRLAAMDDSPSGEAGLTTLACHEAIDLLTEIFDRTECPCG